MRRFILFFVLSSMLGSAVAADLPTDEVIQKFAAKEAAFRKAREDYTYRQSVKVEELDGSGNVQGKWEEVQDVTFGPNKQREEKVIYAPMNTLHLLLTPQDLQVVKTFGKGVGLLKRGEDNQFPRFETYREQIDGKYWFPTYTRANDTLHFKDSSQRIRMVVKYENYKHFGADTNITFGDEVPDAKDGNTNKKK